jgi:hypothetical protein
VVVDSAVNMSATVVVLWRSACARYALLIEQTRHERGIELSEVVVAMLVTIEVASSTQATMVALTSTAPSTATSTARTIAALRP